MSRVIVAYQGGESCHDALAFGAAWARSSGEKLTVVTVHPGSAPWGVGRVDEEWIAAERALAQGLLDQARAELPADIDAEFIPIDAASAAHGIHVFVGDETESIVVLGTHRDASEKRTFPGSTAERLFNGAGCPVTIVPSGYAHSAPERLTRVTCAFVDTRDGRTALAHAATLAERLGAALRLVSVVPEVLLSPTTGDITRFAAEQSHQLRMRLEQAARELHTSVPVTAEMLDGPVASALSSIGPEEADLLVCGSRGYGPILRVLLGGVSARVVRNALVPVAVVPRGD